MKTPGSLLSIIIVAVCLLTAFATTANAQSNNAQTGKDLLASNGEKVETLRKLNRAPQLASDRRRRYLDAAGSCRAPGVVSPQQKARNNSDKLQFIRKKDADK